MDRERMICDRCGDVIGVYEPLVVVTDGEAHETSAAAEPNIASTAAEHYHPDCHKALACPQTD